MHNVFTIFKALKKILVIDNYDSFTFNLVQLANSITRNKATIWQNDQIEFAQMHNFDKIILSPGPGIPSEAGLLVPFIKEFASSKSILGVCLGHQAIGEAFGACLTNLDTVHHGISSSIKVFHKNNLFNNDLFHHLPGVIDVGRYHSWAIDKNTLSQDFTITAEDENGILMAMQHNRFDIQGVQFHPESIMTPLGDQMIRNWLRS